MTEFGFSIFLEQRRHTLAPLVQVGKKCPFAGAQTHLMACDQVSYNCGEAA